MNRTIIKIEINFYHLDRLDVARWYWMINRGFYIISLLYLISFFFFFLLNFDVNAIELKKERTWGEVCLTSGDKDQWQTIH